MGEFNIEVTPASDIGRSQFFRGLIMGSAHVGKTSAVLMTCPKPAYVINCDKKISLNPGTELCLKKKLNLQWKSSFVDSYDKMEAAIKVAKHLVKEERYKTIVLDTISGYSKTLFNHCVAKANMADSKKPKGMLYWPAYHSALEAVVDRLHALDAHVVICSHWEGGSGDDDEDEDAKENKAPFKTTPKFGTGIIPMLGGKSRLKAAGWFEDILFMEKRKNEERVLRCSIEGVWGPASKSLPGVSEVPADIGAFIKAKEDRLKRLVASARGR